MSENQLKLDRHFLLCIGNIKSSLKDEILDEYIYLKSNFCGRVQYLQDEDIENLDVAALAPHGNVYMCGDVKLLYDESEAIPSNIKVIKEFSYNAKGIHGLEYVNLGEVPINLHNVAIYFRNCPASDAPGNNTFDILQTKHKFQALTESNKPGTSYRKGIYLSEVVESGDTSEFHLLRCSTNLDGPTLAFADEDRSIVSKINELAEQNFEQKTELNHVLAQIYENSVTTNDSRKAKEHKAKIKSHSDKTKDMSANGLIAFCTFYSSDIDSYKTKPHDRFDRYFKDASVLTQLRFKLKNDVSHLPLQTDFRVALYPSSVLLIPLSTNRLYTHEIVPPTLPVGRFPTRLGYVVRCSKTKAFFKDSTTFIQSKIGPDVRLQRPTESDMGELKRLYQEENATANVVEYGDVYFSLNEGDYKRPLVE